MKTILILGNKGMLGATLEKYFNLQGDKYNVRGLNRSSFDATKLQLYDNIDFSVYDYVINCIGVTSGIIKRDREEESFEEHLTHPTHEVIQVNSVLPWWLTTKTRNLIHISTDCVFKPDNYCEAYGIYSESYATDLYGMTKRLGEVRFNGMTLRCSFIGPSLNGDGVGLFDWLVRESKKKRAFIYGYTNHYWNGITSLHLARFINKIIDNEDSFDYGIHHLYSPEKITKYDLCCMVNEVFDLNLHISKYDDCEGSRSNYTNRCLSNLNMYGFPEEEISKISELMNKSLKSQLIELKEFIKENYK